MSENFESICPQCGATNVAGRTGCQYLFDELHYMAFGNFRIARVHRLAFDTYCMQHIESYCVSAKSYAAHLVGLCCGVERESDPAVYDVIHRWLNGKVDLVKPPVLSNRGDIRVTDVLAVEEVEERVKAIHGWAQNVWEAYSSQHEIARQWTDAAVAQKY